MKWLSCMHWIGKIILKKNNKFEGLKLHSFKLTTKYNHWGSSKRYIGQWNGILSPEINPYLYIKWFLIRVPRLLYGERTDFLTNGVKTTYSHAKAWSLYSFCWTFSSWSQIWITVWLVIKFSCDDLLLTYFELTVCLLATDVTMEKYTIILYIICSVSLNLFRIFPLFFIFSNFNVNFELLITITLYFLWYP